MLLTQQQAEAYYNAFTSLEDLGGLLLKVVLTSIDPATLDHKLAIEQVMGHMIRVQLRNGRGEFVDGELYSDIDQFAKAYESKV